MIHRRRFRRTAPTRAIYVCPGESDEADQCPCDGFAVRLLDDGPRDGGARARCKVDGLLDRAFGPIDRFAGFDIDPALRRRGQNDRMFDLVKVGAKPSVGIRVAVACIVVYWDRPLATMIKRA